MDTFPRDDDSTKSVRDIEIESIRLTPEGSHSSDETTSSVNGDELDSSHSKDPTNEVIFKQKSDTMIASYHDPVLRPLIEEMSLVSGRIRDVHGFPKLLMSAQFSDIDLIVGPEEQRIQAHKNILCERSKFFEKLLINEACTFNGRLEERDISRYRLPYCHFESVKTILRYLYTGEIQHSQHPGFITRLYKDADFLGVEKVKRYALDLVELIAEYGASLPRLYMVAAPGQADTLNYVVATVRGLSQSFEGKEWEELDGGFFKSLVMRRDFDEWMNNRGFLDLLDDNPIPARIMLQKYGQCKERKVEQSKEKEMEEMEEMLAKEREIEEKEKRNVETQERATIDSWTLFGNRRRVISSPPPAPAISPPPPEPVIEEDYPTPRQITLKKGKKKKRILTAAEVQEDHVPPTPVEERLDKEELGPPPPPEE